MALYFLEYDLRKERDYKKLYEELSKFGAVRILKSLWCFNLKKTPAIDIINHFRKFTDNDDGLMVAEVVDWATINELGNPNQL